MIEASLHDTVGEWVCFHVSDTGIGVSEEQIKRIFDPFVQAEVGFSRQCGGAGLGLSISPRLARLMGGDITVESALGVGSRFTLWLPTVADELEGGLAQAVGL